MTRAAILAPLFGMCLLAAGCSDEATPSAEQGGAASGEVLAGSISDAMIPLEQLESQAPLAPRQAVPVGDIDAEQPEITPAEGIEGAAPSEGAEAASAAPAPEPAE